MNATENRIANISIVIRDKTAAPAVNDILGRHGDVIHGRLGMPYPSRGISIITILVDADNARIGAISGALGNVPGVTLRSTMLV